MKIEKWMPFLLVTFFLGLSNSIAESPPGSPVATTAQPAGEITAKRDGKVSMDFENAKLQDILKAFSKQTGANFIASEIIVDKVMTVYLNNVTVEEALASMLEANDLAYEKQEGAGDVYLIKPAGNAPIRTITRIFKLSYIQVYDLDMKPDEEGFRETSGFTIISSGAVSSTQRGTTTEEKGEKPKNIIEIVQSLMSEHGKIAADKRSNSLIVTDIARNFPAIEKTIKELDVKPIQVLIEAEILETTTDAVKRVGVEFGSTTSTATITYGKGGDSGTGQQAVVPVPGALPESFIKDIFNTTLAASGLFKYGTLTASDVQIVLKLFAENEDTKFLSKPRVLTLNNEAAIIKATENTSIGQDQITISQSGDILSKAERVETGVLLKVRPMVNDKGYIFMYLEPSIARAQASTFFSNTYMDPQVRSSTSTVMVRDGDTVVIAGLIKTDNYKTLRKVPILGDIPFIGEVFRSRYKKTEDTEILIFVTPHIITDRRIDLIIPDKIVDRDQAMQDALAKYGKK